MAPRRKQTNNSDMPTGLSPVQHRGKLRFRYRYPSGKDFWFPHGTSRADAVEASCIFNNEYRNPKVLILEQEDKYNRTIKYWMPKVISRVKRDEKLSAQVIVTFLSNCDMLIESHGDVYSKSISLETVNDFVEQHAKHKSIEVQNRKILFLCKVFDYLVDMSATAKNYARDKKLRPTAKKVMQRLKAEHYQAIFNAAPAYLKTAMDISLQTTHSVFEVSRLKYSDCNLFARPELIEGVLVFGYLRIHRHKVKDKETSRVEIPITQALKTIIDNSREDKVLSPYLVHKISKRSAIPKTCDHPTQLTSDYISKAFSRVRDELRILCDIDKAKRPSFHEIRALSIHLFDQAGIDPQARAAHAKAETTMIYKENHVQWIRVPAGEVKIG